MWILEQIPEELPRPPDGRLSKVLQLLPLDGPPLLVLLHVYLVLADLDLGVVLDSAAGLDQEVVDAPIPHVVSADDGAVVGVEMEVAGPVGVQQVDEAGVVSVEEVLGDVVVDGGDLVAVAEEEDLLDGGGPHDLPETGLGELVKVLLEGLVPLAADVEDDDGAALAAGLLEALGVCCHGRVQRLPLGGIEVAGAVLAVGTASVGGGRGGLVLGHGCGSSRRFGTPDADGGGGGGALTRGGCGLGEEMRATLFESCTQPGD